MLKELFGRIYRRLVPFSVENDEINDAQKMALQNHSDVVDAVKVATARRLECNKTLRSSLLEARVRVFADFEDMLEADHKKGMTNGHGS